MTLTKNIVLTLLALISFCSAISQEDLRTVVAKNGDGILSILRDEGIEIEKYYEEFLELNQDKLNNGSRLVIGETYIIPNAPDSFKKRGVLIHMNDGAESPIFKNELASLKLKDSSLIHTVYYLIEPNRGRKKTISDTLKEGITINMARKLLESRARVYLLTNSAEDSLDLLDYVSVVNKKYLKHKGDYQRLLVINDVDVGLKSKTDVTVYHYAESIESKRFADNILKVFGKNTIKHEALNDYSLVFTDFKNITFAKNIVPPITYVEMGSNKPENKKTIKVRANNENIADLLTNGILSDYSNTTFEDNK